MFCPYCKDELEVRNGELYCKTGKCYFSKHIESALIEKIGNTKNFQLCKLDDEDKKEGHFHCVNCGNKMKKIEPIHEVCICCGFEINKSMYHEIIELNPHFK